MYKFDKRSLKNLEQTHPLLKKLHLEAIKIAPWEYIITDSMRGRIAQTKAYQTGHSKVKFGESAHNYFPAVANDCYPAPFSDRIPVSKFIILQLGILLPLAKKMGIPVRQGVDFNMNGNLSDDRWDDLPHIELHPWREWVKKSKLKLYEG